MDELIFPYAAKQSVGIHDIRGDVFRLASCEVLYKSRRVRQSERDNRWVRLSTGYNPTHATNWTHAGVPQSIYIFLNFDNEADYQAFGIGTHEDVIFSVADTFSIGDNKWELKLAYRRSLTESTPIEDTTSIDKTPVDDVSPAQSSVLVAEGRFVASISLAELATLAIRQRSGLYNVEKVISTGFKVIQTGGHWVQISSGRTDMDVFIYAQEGAFARNTTYFYVHVSVERLVTRGGHYELWLTHIP